MYQIHETTKTRIGDVWPSGELLAEFKDPDVGRGDFGGLVSTMLVEAMLGNDHYNLGDSPVSILVTGNKAKGEEAVEELKEAGRILASLIESAIPAMSDPGMKSYYQYYLDDFKTNGLSMPFYGKLL